MKILQVITNLELGGAQKATLNLSEWLMERGHDVVVVSSSKGGLYRRVKEIFGRRFKEIRFLEREINPIYDLIAFFSLFIFILENKFDLVHTHTSKAGILGRWAAFFALRTRNIHTVHGFAFHDYQNKIVKSIFVILERATAVITDRIIAVSESVKNKGLRYGIADENKYSVIYELVDVSGYSDGGFMLRENRSYQKTFFRIGMVAALKPQKNPQDFIKLAAIMMKKRKNLEFLLIGDGVLRNRLNKMVEKYSIKENFKILGWREDAYELMKSFDILVLTSLFEGQPHVIIEAMSLGIPIVATKVDGIKDIVINGSNGFLFPPKKPYQMARCIENILDKDEVKKALSSNARNYFREEKKMDYMHNLGRIESIYQEIISGSDRNY